MGDQGGRNHLQGLTDCSSEGFPARTTEAGTSTLGDLPLLANLSDSEVISVFVLDPLDALQLRVHHERPALAVEEDGGILQGHAVCRKALVLPGSHVSIIHQQPQGIQARGDRDGDLAKQQCQPHLQWEVGATI